jgi:hypothetical protein
MKEGRNALFLLELCEEKLSNNMDRKTAIIKYLQMKTKHHLALLAEEEIDVWEAEFSQIREIKLRDKLVF